MKSSIALLVFLIGLVSCTLPGHNPDPENLDRQQGNYRIVLSTIPAQPRVGKNLFQMRLSDARGRPILDATVTFSFRMSHMSFRMYQVAEGKMAQPGLYEVEAELNMGGNGDVVVEVERPALPKFSEEFVVDAGDM